MNNNQMLVPMWTEIDEIQTENLNGGGRSSSGGSGIYAAGSGNVFIGAVFYEKAEFPKLTSFFSFTLPPSR
jgi:hypothetical protein